MPLRQLRVRSLDLTKDSSQQQNWGAMGNSMLLLAPCRHYRVAHQLKPEKKAQHKGPFSSNMLPLNIKSAVGYFTYLNLFG